MTRFSGALALIHARPTGAVVVLRLTPAAERAHVACVLSQALLSAGSSHVRAIDLRDRVTELPLRDRTPVLVAVIRSLLDGAPDVCERLDRAVRDAATAHDHEVTATHEALAEEVLT